MELETDRLLLREFDRNDWRPMLDIQSDPRFMEFYDWHSRTADDVKQFVQMFLDWQQAQPRTKYQLALVLKSSNQLIGSCGIRLDNPNAIEGDIGYEVAADFWGQGYATEAATAMVDFGFQTLKLHRVWSWCIAENMGSARVLEKLGMQQEGRLRHKELFKGRWWDHLVYGLLTDEWRNPPKHPL